jgi:transcriptional regulator with XRE-family HTH domain
MDMRRLVGRNVKRIRLEKGLTQEQYAERSGFTQQYISGLEQGRRNPTVVTVFELAQALGVGHVELVAPDIDTPIMSRAPTAKVRRPKG